MKIVKTSLFFTMFLIFTSCRSSVEVTKGVEFQKIDINKFSLHPTENLLIGIEYNADLWESKLVLYDFALKEKSYLIPYPEHRLNDNPGWHSGGRKIIFFSNHLFPPEYNIGEYDLRSEILTPLSNGYGAEWLEGTDNFIVISNVIKIFKDGVIVHEITPPNYDTERIVSFAMSPDGDKVAIQSKFSEGKRIYLIDIRYPEETALLYEGSMNMYINWSSDGEWIFTNVREDPVSNQLIAISVTDECIAEPFTFLQDIENVDPSRWNSEVEFREDIIVVSGEYKGEFGIFILDREIHDIDFECNVDSPK